MAEDVEDDMDDVIIDEESQVRNDIDDQDVFMKELLNPDINHFKLALQSLYMAKQCRFFYLGLISLATLMVIWILFEGIDVHQSILFLFLEIIVNMCILMDFIFKLYLKGFNKFFKSWTNIFDALVVGSWILTFSIMFFTTSTSLIMVEEVVEEVFFVLWCSLQYIRIILFIKSQNEAKSNSKPIDYKLFHLDSIQEDGEKP